MNTKSLNRVTLREFYTRTFAPQFLCGARPRTLDAYRTTLAHFSRHVPPDEHIITAITVETLARYKAASIAAGDATATTNKHLRHVAHLLNKLGPRGPRNRDALAWLAEVPWTKPLRERRAQPRVVTDDEFRRLYTAADHAQRPTPFPAAWWRAWLVMALTRATTSAPGPTTSTTPRRPEAVPRREEREAINAAFDDLFKAIKHEVRSDHKGEHITRYRSGDQPERYQAQRSPALDRSREALAIAKERLRKAGPFTPAGEEPADRYAFDASKHPRGQPDNAGQFAKKPANTRRKFSSGGGGQSSGWKANPQSDLHDNSAEWHAEFQATEAKFSAAINDHFELPKEMQAKYLETSRKILRRLPRTALSRIRRHVLEIQFYKSTRDLRDSVAPGDSRQIAGCYDTGDSTPHLDGNTEDGVLAEDSYCHEFAHAIDGSRSEITSSPAWQEAWNSEVGPNSPYQLTPAASANPSEGFAEFLRLVYTSKLTRKEIESQWPMCTQLLKNFSLWE